MGLRKIDLSFVTSNYGKATATITKILIKLKRKLISNICYDLGFNHNPIAAYFPKGINLL